MKFISLGHDCCTRTRINEFILNEIDEASHFFDWILSDFHTVLYVLKSILNNDDIINKKTFNVTGDATDKGNHIICCNTMYLTSLHDVKSTTNVVESIDIICKKYRRRIDRFKHMILNENICFICNSDNENPIHYGNINISSQDIRSFFYLLNSIVPNNTHKLIVISNSSFCESIFSEFRFKHIDSSLFVTHREHPKDWYRWYFDWSKIFDIIISYSKE